MKLLTRKTTLEVEVDLEATDPSALLEHATPKGVWLRLDEDFPSSNYFPIVRIGGEREAVTEFIKFHWGAQLQPDGSIIDIDGNDHQLL